MGSRHGSIRYGDHKMANDFKDGLVQTNPFLFNLVHASRQAKREIMKLAYFWCRKQGSFLLSWTEPTLQRNSQHEFE